MKLFLIFDTLENRDIIIGLGVCGGKELGPFFRTRRENLNSISEVIG